LKAEKAIYRAYSDIIDLRVCAACASEAWWLGLRVEMLDRWPTRHQPLFALPKRVANGGHS
jgi:hypothetical protein